MSEAPSSSSPRPKKGGGGGGGGRGRGGHRQKRGRGRGGGGGGNNSNRNKHGGASAGGKNNEAVARLSDEEVMIAFLPHMRSGNARAAAIHSEYGSDHRTFINKAREFLLNPPDDDNNDDNEDDGPPSSPPNVEAKESKNAFNAGDAHAAAGDNNEAAASAGDNDGTTKKDVVGEPPNIAGGGLPDLSGLSVGGGDDDAVGPSGGVSAIPSNPFASDLSQQLQQQQAGTTGRLNAVGPALASPPPQSMKPVPASAGMLRPTPPGIQPQQQQGGGGGGMVHPGLSSPPQAAATGAPAPAAAAPPISSSTFHPSPPALPTSPTSAAQQQQQPRPTPSSGMPTTPAAAATAGPDATAAPETPAQSSEKPTPATPATTTKPVWQPRRTHTRLETQAGIVSCNGVQNDAQNRQLVIGPRSQLQATWSLPLSYLRERTIRRLGEKGMSPEHANSLTIRDALSTLTVGLFRRGCTENGENSSIVSKEIVPDDRQKSSSDHGGPKDGYAFQVRHDLVPPSVVGTVPFYTPRTPGNVVLRLYFENEPVITLATGPVVRVATTDSGGLESTLRFVLSNFKAKAGTANFTSLHNFAILLEQFRPDEDGVGGGGNRRGGGRGGRNNRGRDSYDGAGRAAFGCLAESRRVVDYSYDEYMKKNAKLAKEEEALTLLMAEPGECEDEDDDEVKEKKAEDLNQVKRDIASNEKKWREIQAAFYAVLKAAFYNPASKLILRREVMSQVKLEIGLYCQFCECFAKSPFTRTWGISNFPRTITAEHFEQVREAKMNMQQEILGFVPRICSLSSVIQGSNFEGRNASRDPKTALDEVSTSMIQLYDKKYRVTTDVAKMREQCRKDLEAAVASCSEVFPRGTRVVVFGSCANGFGSPSSDLDMCLQLPANTSLADDDDNGASAMAKLAEKLEAAGLEDVDTVRLTARIPVLMFNYPIIKPDGEKILLDCDLSMQNPLACLNTSLLLSYASISPQTRVLVSIIKRWAKTRDINSPKDHTLSSYGYILMLIHFLTHHATSIDGKVVPYYEAHARRGGQYLTNQPLLPNLQRMKQEWPQSPRGTAYSEMPEKPRNQYCLMPHPTESSFTVNTFFYRVSDQAQKENLKQRFAPSQTGFDPSVAVLLAEFFRYYAVDFDFKKHVVSLNSSFSTGLIEKEAKAESDAWSLYRQILAIEDPFETFYDVAHVLKPGTFQRVKREFVMAYSKLIDAMTGGGDASWWEKDNIHAMSGNDIVDWLCEPLPVEDEEEQ